jgi:methionyl-tRNA formyltransferase
MRVLYLGPDSWLVDWIEMQGDWVVQTEQAPIKIGGCDLIVSYGYRHILRDLSIPAVNLHISLLPWNRGADPNLWSWMDNTPKGVTLHWIDEGIDTGDIIAQVEVAMGDETLTTSYAKLKRSAEALFMEYWDAIKDGTAPRRKQDGCGSFHRAKDKPALPDGWDTRCTELTPLG